MKIVIVGCSGFVGMQLRSFFEKAGSHVISLQVREGTQLQRMVDVLEGVDVLINLAGLSIFGRWNEAYKKKLYTSRIDTTSKLVEAMASCKHRPKCFISTSAVGIYPNDIESDEYQNEVCESFLAHICRDWEKEAFMAKHLDVRTVVLRSGVVLGKEGGMFKKLYFPFLFGVGGKIGSGEQPLSWIHIDDLCAIYKVIIEDECADGIYNLCAPEPTTNIELTKTLGSLLSRPTVFAIPAWIIRLAFAEGSTLMLEGQKVYPKKLLESGFEFKYPTIREALKSFF